MESKSSDTDLVSVGVSAISQVGNTYSQNEKTLDGYYARLDKGELPVIRGIEASMDDLMRRRIIQMLMCHFELSMQAVELAYPVTFKEYFAPELEKLRAFESDGLIKIEDNWLTVTLKGRLLIRNICMAFDKYLGLPRPASSGEVQPLRFSKTI